LALIGGAIGKRKRLLKPAEDAFANLLMMLTSGFCVCGHSEFNLGEDVRAPDSFLRRWQEMPECARRCCAEQNRRT
jgi:hypothetical protein